MRFLGTSSVILVGHHEIRANDLWKSWDVVIVGVGDSMPKTQAGSDFGDYDTNRTGTDKLGCWKFRRLLDYVLITAHRGQHQPREQEIQKTSYKRVYGSKNTVVMSKLGLAATAATYC